MIIKLVDTKLNKIFLIGTIHSDELEQLNKLKEVIISNKLDVVLMEGNFHQAEFSNKDEAIKKGKEMGYVSFICKNMKIPLFSNDPTQEQMFDFIKKEFGEKQAKDYLKLRENKKYEDYFNPLLNLNKFNKITRRLNIFRDSYMLDKILIMMKSYKNIMIVKGEQHIKENIEKIRKAVKHE